MLLLRSAAALLVIIMLAACSVSINPPGLTAAEQTATAIIQAAKNTALALQAPGQANMQATDSARPTSSPVQTTQATALAPATLMPTATRTAAPTPTQVPTPTLQPTTTETPTLQPRATETPTPTVTPIPPLYQADWSGETTEWGGPGWKTVGGMLVYDGKGFGRSVVLAPYTPETPDYVVEAEIQFVRLNAANNYPPLASLPEWKMIIMAIQQRCRQPMVQGQASTGWTGHGFHHF